MGFWGSFLGNAAGHAIKEMQQEDKENKRWNELFDELQCYEERFNNYLESMGIDDIYCSDVEAVNNGNLLPELRKMDNLKNKIKEYIDLGGICQYIYYLENIDDEIRKIKYLKSVGCLNRQNEFVNMSIPDIEQKLGNEKNQKESIEKSFAEETTDCQIPDVDLNSTYTFAGVNVWNVDDNNFFEFTFKIVCNKQKIKLYIESNNSLIQTK